MSDKEVMIRIDFGSTGIFEFPAKFIAENKAVYYATKDSGGMTHVPIFERVFEDTLYSDDALYDWFRNNMNWSNVERHAKRVTDVEEPDYDELMNEAKIGVVR
jgi:hypothetical protein